MLNYNQIKGHVMRYIGKIKTPLIVIAIMLLGVGANLSIGMINPTIANGGCEDDLCLDTETAGWVCVDHAQIGGEEGYDCNVVQDGADCCADKCGDGQVEPCIN